MADSKSPVAKGNNSSNTPANEGDQQQAGLTKYEEAGEVLETLRDAAVLVKKYAVGIVGKQEAQEFATHISIMVQQNPKIKECDPNSVVKAMMACVRIGLMPNTPEQYVALIPYGKELQFQIMYRGLAQLAYNTGVVNKIDAQLVFPGDEWSIEEGTERKLVHKWTAESLEVDRTKPENALFVYSTAVLNTGERTFQVMNQSEVKQIKEQAVKATGNDTPWVKWPAEQYKKTVVKRFAKLLPKSNTDNRLAYALQVDNLAEGGKFGAQLDIKGNIIEGETVTKTAADAAGERRKQIAAAEARHNASKKPFTPKPEATNE